MFAPVPDFLPAPRSPAADEDLEEAPDPESFTDAPAQEGGSASFVNLRSWLGSGDNPTPKKAARSKPLKKRAEVAAKKQTDIASQLFKKRASPASATGTELVEKVDDACHEAATDIASQLLDKNDVPTPISRTNIMSQLNARRVAPVQIGATTSPHRLRKRADPDSEPESEQEANTASQPLGNSVELSARLGTDILPAVASDAPVVACLKQPSGEICVSSGSRAAPRGQRNRHLRRKVAVESDSDEASTAQPTGEHQVPEAPDSEEASAAPPPCRESVCEEPEVLSAPAAPPPAQRRVVEESESVSIATAPGRRRVLEESEGEEALAAAPASRRKVAEESDSDEEATAQSSRQRENESSSAVSALQRLAKPTVGIWQVSLDGCSVWGEAHVGPSSSSSYFQQAGDEGSTPLRIRGDGSEDSPFHIKAATLIESGPSLCVWQWPDGRTSRWTPLQPKSSKAKRRRRSVAMDTEGSQIGQGRSDKEDKKRRKSEKKERRRRKASRAKSGGILNDSWELWLASTRPKSPSPARPFVPLGLLADSDAESYSEEEDQVDLPKCSADEEDNDAASAEPRAISEASPKSARSKPRPRRRGRHSRARDARDAADGESSSSEGAAGFDKFASSCSRDLLRSR